MDHPVRGLRSSETIVMCIDPACWVISVATAGGQLGTAAPNPTTVGFWD